MDRIKDDGIMILALIIAVAVLALALLLLREISDRHRALQARHRARAEVERLAKLALRDELTGLPNRRAAEVEIDRAIARAARAQRMVAAHFLDIDHFKVINDQHGHAVGDAVLVEIARRLAECVRESDTVARLDDAEDGDRIARLHGDEFMVIQCMVAAREEAVRLAQRLAECLDGPIVVGGLELRVTVSIGFALAPLDAVLAADLRRIADAEMYRAKRERNRGMGAAA